MDEFEDLQVSDPYENIPDEMKRENRWLVYRLEPAANNKKNKIPYNPKTQHKANDPKLGVSFEEAKAAVVFGGFSGLGFYVESPYLVIDIDGCVDPHTGDVTAEAAGIVRELNTYSELSPSYTGIHVWGKGTKPGTACRRASLELYTEKRFLTITGVQVPGTPKEVREVNIAPIYSKMVSEPKAQKDEHHPEIKSIVEVQSGGKALTTKIELLMHGQIVSTRPFIVQDDFNNSVEYPSQSEGDGALVTLLAFKHFGDPEKIDSDFRVSSLYRDKWDRADYRDQTIKSGIAFYRKSKELERFPNIPSIEVSTSDDEDVIVDYETKLPEFPKFTGSLTDLCDAMSPDIPHPFKFCAALTHFGLIRSGLDTLRRECHLMPRFYCALIAEPGRGKTAAINEISRIMRPLSNKYQVFSSIDSAPSLVDTFADLNRSGIIKSDGTNNLVESVLAKVLLSPDELTDLFEKSKMTQNSKNSMVSEMLKLFETTVTGNRARGAKVKIHLENAHLAILGGATEAGYSSMWTGTLGNAGGLQSRFICVSTENRKMPSMQRPANLEKVVQISQILADQMKQPAFQYEFTQNAFSLFDKWWSSKEQTKSSETRVDGIVKRVLIVLARTNNCEIITEDLVEQGISFGDYLICARERFAPLDASSWCQMEENLIISVFQKHPGITVNMCRKLVHPERRAGGIGPFNQALKNLITSGILRESGRTQRSIMYKLSL